MQKKNTHKTPIGIVKDLFIRKTNKDKSFLFSQISVFPFLSAGPNLHPEPSEMCFLAFSEWEEVLLSKKQAFLVSKIDFCFLFGCPCWIFFVFFSLTKLSETAKKTLGECWSRFFLREKKLLLFFFIFVNLKSGGRKRLFVVVVAIGRDSGGDFSSAVVSRLLCVSDGVQETEFCVF